MASPPEIIGEPTIKQEGANVVLEATVKGVDATTIKWSVKVGEEADKDIDKEKCKPSTKDLGDGKTAVICTITPFDKPLAGVYKADFANATGPNHCTFNLTAGNAPEFTDKPHIAQRDGGAVIVIKCRGKSHKEMTVDWQKDDKPVEFTDRVKAVMAKDNKDEKAFQFNLEIHGPMKEDEGKYTCILKNAEGSNTQSLNLCFD